MLANASTINILLFLLLIGLLDCPLVLWYFGLADKTTREPSGFVMSRWNLSRNGHVGRRAEHHNCVRLSNTRLISSADFGGVSDQSDC